MADTTTPISAAALEDFFETPDLSELDPTTQGGAFRLTYSREVPLEMRLQTTDAAPAEAGTLEAIHVKIAVAEAPDGRPKQVKIELSSEADLFFMYSHVVDEKTFNAMRDDQKLTVDFATYATILATSFQNAIKEPHTFLAVFIMNRDGQARLDFIQNVSFKFVELLSIHFNRAPEETIRQSIAYRYNAVKSKLGVLQARLQDVVNLVKIKNPSLLLQLQKPGLGGAATGMGIGGAGATAAAGAAMPMTARSGVGGSGMGASMLGLSAAGGRA